MIRTASLITAALVLAACGPRELEPDQAFECKRCAEWNEPIEPFRIHGNTWYVGTDGLSSILVDTGNGLVLLDGALPQSAELIVTSIETLGFDPRDIKVILISHAHFDHAGGVNAIQRFSGARVIASESAASVLETGRLGEDDPQYGYGAENTTFPAAKIDSVLGDGEQFVLGDVRFTAIYTPGHTQGGTTWTWESCALNACLDVVYADSLTAVSAPGFSFATSGYATQMTESADKIANLDCDILLSPHPFFFGLHDKLERDEAGNPFVNSVACSIYAEQALGWLERRLAQELD
ncbi:MAG: subclass B3 metallo-beta-lactamase [Woeseiaceae bacterium]|nr:subclass B3 metallo-beta-lactamase [Woeseiaceae bacterium]